MNQEPPIQNILFLDIETVPGKKNFSELDPELQALYEAKTQRYREEDESLDELYKRRAGILSEFNKVVCISTAIMTESEKGAGMRVKSFIGKDEKKVLADFAHLLDQYFSGNNKFLCAHNGKEFDFPVLARRMLIHGIKLPEALRISGKKPWEIRHLDTMELWKFGDYKNFTSLKLLAALFGIPSPKDDIDGSQVGSVYYEEGDLDRIKTYCEKDTITVAKVYRALNQYPEINDDCIEIIES